MGQSNLKEFKMNERINNEINRVAEAMLRRDTSERKYCELQVIRQSLSWALNPKGAMSPFDYVFGKFENTISSLPEDNLPD